MSDYIPAGGYYNYGQQQSQRPPLKSVYYPPQQPQSPTPQGSQQQFSQGGQQQFPQGSQQQFSQGGQQQFPQASQQQFSQGGQQQFYQGGQQHQMNQFPQGQQLPPGAVPVLNKIQTPAGVKLVSFQQEVTASIPPQLQQQLKQLQQQQQESVYMGMPNNLYLVSNRPRDYHYQPQPQASDSNLMSNVGGYNNYGSTQQQPQQQQSQQQLNQFPQVAQQKLNPTPQGSQHQFPQGAQQQIPQGGQQQIPQGSQYHFPQGSHHQFPQGQKLPSGAVPVLNKIETPAGVKLVSFQQEVTASIPPQLQQQFKQMQQQQQESLYMGIPNDLYLVSNRPGDYHYQSQPQASDSNLMSNVGGYNSYGSTQQQPQQQQSQQQLNQFPQGAQQKLNPTPQGSQHQFPQGAQQIPEGGQQQIPQGSQHEFPQGGQEQEAGGSGGGATLQGGSSDYHFDALRGLSSAY